MPAPKDRLSRKFAEVEADRSAWLEQCLVLTSSRDLTALSKHSFSYSDSEEVSELLFEGVKLVNKQNLLIARLRVQAQVLTACLRLSSSYRSSVVIWEVMLDSAKVLIVCLGTRVQSQGFSSKTSIISAK